MRVRAKMCDKQAVGSCANAANSQLAVSRPEQETNSGRYNELEHAKQKMHKYACKYDSYTHRWNLEYLEPLKC